MLCSPPFDNRAVRDARTDTAYISRPASLSTDKVIVRKEAIGGEEVRDVGTKTAGHFGEDADDLTALLTLQLTDMIISFDQLNRRKPFCTLLRTVEE